MNKSAKINSRCSFRISFSNVITLYLCLYTAYHLIVYKEGERERERERDSLIAIIKYSV